MNKIRCLVVDDHILLRQGVRRLLEGEPDFDVVAEAGDAAEALDRVRELRPDVVLMDIGMSGLSSFEAVRCMREEVAATKIIFLTMFEDEDYMMQCFKAGASGYVLKDTPVPELFGAVREVFHGGSYFSPRVLGRVIEDMRINSPESRARHNGSILTPREREVIKLLAEGNSREDGGSAQIQLDAQAGHSQQGSARDLRDPEEDCQCASERLVRACLPKVIVIPRKARNLLFARFNTCPEG